MQRRIFLGRAASIIGLASFPRTPAGGQEPKGKQRTRTLLDEFRESLYRWSERLWDGARGGFRQNEQVGVNLMSTTDIAWIRHAVNEERRDDVQRERWIAYLRRAQDPHTGVVAYNAPPRGHTHNDGHCLWHTVRALRLLGGELPLFPQYLQEATTPAGLKMWFAARDWEGTAHHHEVLGLVPVLANHNDAEWTDTFFREIETQQNSANGCWPKTKVNVSRTFAYSVMHRGLKRIPPAAERIIDTMLAMQSPNGLWGEQPTFHTMDVAYLLVRLPPLVSHREADCRAALARLGRFMQRYVKEELEGVMQEGTHRMLAVAHTLGLLQEQFPDEYRSERAYQFGWDVPEQYRCAVIARRLG